MDLAEFGADVDAWHRSNWPATDDGANNVLGITKVAEEAGELVGALTKHHEHRGSEQDILDELGDVVIAAAGAARRLTDLLGRRIDIDEVVAARWATVSQRRYGAPA